MKEFLTSLFENAEGSAQQQQQKAQKARDADVDMYRGVLMSPDSSPEQREKAAQEIGKLRNLKKGENPFDDVAKHLNALGEHIQSRGGTGHKVLGGLAEGAGAVIGGVGRAVTGAQPKQVPPVDPGVFPTSDQITKNKVSGIRQEEEAKITSQVEGMSKALKAQGFTDEQIKAVIQAKIGGAGFRKGMHPVKVSDPNNPLQQIPALQDPNTGQVYGPDGQEIQDPKVVPVSTLPRDSTTEQLVIDPKTNQLVAVPVKRHTQVSAPKELPGKPGGSGPSTSPRTIGNYVRPQQFNALQKQATAIDEARNSLIGDEPGKPGGLSGDLEIFKSPESVQRLSEYLGLVTSQMENEGKAVAGQGPMAAIEWYTTLPQTVIDLQQGALRDASSKLDNGAPDGPEHKFVADYFRTMGTIGGMRAATGASSAKWSFNTLRGELPTPGPVTSYPEAVRRVNNYLKETNVVSKRNPLMSGQDTKNLTSLDNDDTIYAKDPSGKLKKAKKGTPLPPGWKLENAPATQ